MGWHVPGVDEFDAGLHSQCAGLFEDGHRGWGQPFQLELGIEAGEMQRYLVPRFFTIQATSALMSSMWSLRVGTTRVTISRCFPALAMAWMVLRTGSREPSTGLLIVVRGKSLQTDCKGIDQVEQLLERGGVDVPRGDHDGRQAGLFRLTGDIRIYSK